MPTIIAPQILIDPSAVRIPAAINVMSSGSGTPRPEINKSPTMAE